MSSGRTRNAHPVGDLDQQRVAGRVAEAVIDGLEVVEVDVHDGDRAAGLAAAGERMPNAIIEEDAVGELGQGIVESLVLELGVLGPHPGQGLLEAAVLEREADLGRERLEEAAVLVVEGADVAQPVGDHDRADDAALADQLGDHRVADAEGAQPGGELGVGAGMEEHRAACLRGQCRKRLLHRVDRHVEQGDRVVAGADPAADGALVRPTGEQDDLGDLGPEHRPDVLEQLHDGRLQAPGPLQHAVRLVEELDRLLPPLLADVGAVGQEEHRRRDQQQPDAVGVPADDGHAEEGHAARGEPAGDGERDGPDDRRRLRPALGQGDDGLHDQAAEGVHDGDRGKPAQPAVDAQQCVRAHHPVEDDLGDGGLEAQLADVEDQLQGRLPAVEGEGDGRAQRLRQDHAHRGREVQPGDERELVQGEGVGLLPDLDVDDGDLADEEEDRQRPPGHQLKAGRGSGKVDDDPEEEDRRRGDERRVECPDPPHDSAHGPDLDLMSVIGKDHFAFSHSLNSSCS